MSTSKWYEPAAIDTKPYYDLTSMTMLPNLLKTEYYLWFRIAYSIVFTILSNWMFIKSNFTSVAWHLHNTGMISTLIGMWLVTISPFIPN